MPTLIHANGSRQVELPRMTVSDARNRNIIPRNSTPVEKGYDGVSKQLSENDHLTGDYILVPSNRAGK